MLHLNNIIAIDFAKALCATVHIAADMGVMSKTYLQKEMFPLWVRIHF